MHIIFSSSGTYCSMKHLMKFFNFTAENEKQISENENSTNSNAAITNSQDTVPEFQGIFFLNKQIICN